MIQPFFLVPTPGNPPDKNVKVDSFGDGLISKNGYARIPTLNQM